MMNSEVEDLLAQYPPQVRDIAFKLRDLVLDSVPDQVERVYPGWKNIGYGTSDKRTDQLCYIAPLKDSVNLGFNRGAELPDPEGLLTGSGKSLRHVKIQKAEDVDANAHALRVLLEAAAARQKAS
jgi:hypothetical protein